MKRSKSPLATNVAETMADSFKRRFHSWKKWIKTTCNYLIKCVLGDFELNQVQQPWVQSKLWPGKCLIAAKCKNPCNQGYPRLPRHVFGSSFFILSVPTYAATMHTSSRLAWSSGGRKPVANILNPNPCKHEIPNMHGLSYIQLTTWIFGYRVVCALHGFKLKQNHFSHGKLQVRFSISFVKFMSMKPGK